MEWAVHNGETTIQLSVEKKNHNDIHNRNCCEIINISLFLQQYLC
jgi:hypothetical protein